MQDGKKIFGQYEVTESNDSLVVNDTKFDKTPGLVDLISNKVPTDYTPDDVSKYKQFLLVTDWPYTKQKKLKSISAKNGNPKKQIQRDLIDELRKTGQGVTNKIFLPSDIKSIRRRLQLCLGEFLAGNSTTRDEIVALLDALQERKAISRFKYQRINTMLSQSL